MDLYEDLITLREPPMRILFLIARQFNLAGKRTDEPGHGEKWDRVQAENAAVCGRQDHAAGKKLQQGADSIICKPVRGYRRSGENRTAG